MAPFLRISLQITHGTREGAKIKVSVKMYVSINCLGLSVKLTSVVIDNVEDVIPILIQNINGKLH